jgi:cytidylate kinase
MASAEGSMIITGPSGAGKSTVARIVADTFERSVLHKNAVLKRPIHLTSPMMALSIALRSTGKHPGMIPVDLDLQPALTAMHPAVQSTQITMTEQPYSPTAPPVLFGGS